MSQPETVEVAPTPAPERLEPPKPIVVERVDLLEANNLSITVQLLLSKRNNAMLQHERALRLIDDDLRETQNQIGKMQAQLAEKYGIDFKKEQIHPHTGEIIPAPKDQA